jgi:hypothetical protein
MARRSFRKSKPLDPKSLDSFKAFLGPIAARYSDPQLIQLRSDMHAAASLLLDLYVLKKQRADKTPSGVFDNRETET